MFFEDQNSDHQSYESQKQNSNDNQNTENQEWLFQSPFQVYQDPKPSGSGHFLRRLLLIFLCVVISFSAGAGGAYLVSQNMGTGNGGNSGIISAPVKDSSLYNDNPESVLSRSDREWSQYGSAGEDVFSISTVVQKVQKSVVVIEATINDVSTGLSGTSSGSGVIVSSEGYILTCNHVVENATNIVVTVTTDVVASGEKQYVASVVGTDDYTDLAVIKITPSQDDPLTFAEHGVSANLVVGEQVVAIGNPLGILGGTVTQGIISATERRVQTSDGIIMTLLQTDAAINSGNSGGGLFNLKGELIGIVNAKYSDTGVEGLGFAIPDDLAYTIEKELIKKGYVSGRPAIDFDVLEVNSNNYSSSLGYYYYYAQVYGSGLYVKKATTSSGLQQYDYISSVNGVAVTSKAHFNAILEQCGVNGTLTVEYKRVSLSRDWLGRIVKNGETSGTVQVTIREKQPDSSVVFP